MFADPNTPVQTCLIPSINKRRFPGFLIYGDRYFIYGKIYPFFCTIFSYPGTGGRRLEHALDAMSIPGEARLLRRTRRHSIQYVL